MTATQRDLVRSEIAVLSHVALVLSDRIARQKGLYHSDEDLVGIKALIDCITLSSRILTTDEIQLVLNVYVNGLAYIASTKSPELRPTMEKLREERKVLEAFLRFRSLL